jgi:hypothetical protein
MGTGEGDCLPDREVCGEGVGELGARRELGGQQSSQRDSTAIGTQVADGVGIIYDLRIVRR